MNEIIKKGKINENEIIKKKEETTSLKKINYLRNFKLHLKKLFIFLQSK